MTQEPLFFSCSGGFRSATMVEVFQTPFHSLGELTVDEVPAPFFRVVIETDRQMELDQIDLTQGYREGNSIGLAQIIRDASVWLDTNDDGHADRRHPHTTVQTDNAGNLLIDMGDDGNRITIERDTPLFLEFRADEIDPEYTTLATEMVVANGIDIRGVRRSGDRPIGIRSEDDCFDEFGSRISNLESCNTRLHLISPDTFTLDFGGECGDGEVDPTTEECDGTPHCTDECTAETGYECEDNECELLIPTLDGSGGDDGGDTPVTCNTRTGDVVEPYMALTPIDLLTVIDAIRSLNEGREHSLSPDQYACADANQDGDLTEEDAEIILQIMQDEANGVVSDTVFLYEASMDGKILSIDYKKSFEPCADIFKRNLLGFYVEAAQDVRFICTQGNHIASSDVDIFNIPIRIGDTIKLCHPNNGGVCSEPIEIIDDGAPSDDATSAKIAMITNANPDPDGAAIPVGVSPIGQFKVTAAPNDGGDDVHIREFKFDVSALNLALTASEFRLYNKADQTVTTYCGAYYLTGQPFAAEKISGAFHVLCTVADSVVQGTIDPGQSETFVLQAEVDSAINQAHSSSLQVSIARGNVEWEDDDGSVFQWADPSVQSVESTLYEW